VYKGVEKVMKIPMIQLQISLLFAEEKYLQALLDYLSIQMSAELVEWWRRWRTQIMRSQVKGGLTVDVVLVDFISFGRRGLITLLLFLYFTEEVGRK